MFSLLKVHGCPTSSGGDCAGSAASLGWECLAQSSEELNKASIPEDVDGQPGLHLRGQTVCCKAINFLKLGQGGTSPNTENFCSESVAKIWTLEPFLTSGQSQILRLCVPNA